MKSRSATIQMKATEQNFPVMLFIMLYKVVLTVSLWMKSLFVTIPVKGTEQFFLMTLFIILYMYVKAKKVTNNFWVNGWDHKVNIQMKATACYFP